MIDLVDFTLEQQAEILEMERNSVLDEILLVIAEETAERD